MSELVFYFYILLFFFTEVWVCVYNLLKEIRNCTLRDETDEIKDFFRFPHPVDLWQKDVLNPCILGKLQICESIFFIERGEELATCSYLRGIVE